MNRRELLIVAGGSAVAAAAPLSLAAEAPTPSSTDPALLERWKTQAQSLIPQLMETEQTPVSLVRAVAAPELPLRFRMEREAVAGELAKRELKRGDSVIVDFEGHRTGFLSF